MSKPTPTWLSLSALRAAGWTVESTERRLPRCRVSVDLFNAFDAVGVHPDRPAATGFQFTDGSHHANRRTKLSGNAAVALWLRCGCRAVVMSWRKAGGRWVAREEELTVADLPEAVPDA
jgi:hypothetical protein